MYKDLVVAVVIPAYNESALIGEVLGTLPQLVDYAIVVDDASSDDTSMVAGSIPDERIVIFRNDKNLGVGGSIVRGHRHALALGADVSVVMAGDAQMDPAYLPGLLDPIADAGYGFAKANRFHSMTSFAGMPRHRVLGNVVLSFLTKAASGYWHIFDPQNGYTAIHREALSKLPLSSLSNGYAFENDLLIQLNLLNVRIKDVPIPAVYGSEKSGIHLRKVIPAISLLLFKGFWKRILWKYVIWSFSPIALLFFCGLAATAFGVGFGIWDIVEDLTTSAAPTSGTVLLAVGPCLLGAQLLIASLILDIIESPR